MVIYFASILKAVFENSSIYIPCGSYFLMLLVIFDWMLDIYSGHGWCSLLAERIHPVLWGDLPYPSSGSEEADHLNLIRNWGWFAAFMRLGCFWLLPLPESFGVYFCLGRSWIPKMVSPAPHASWKLSSAIHPLFVQHISISFSLCKNYQINRRESRYRV